MVIAVLPLDLLRSAHFVACNDLYQEMWIILNLLRITVHTVNFSFVHLLTEEEQI